MTGETPKKSDAKHGTDPLKGLEESCADFVKSWNDGKPLSIEEVVEGVELQSRDKLVLRLVVVELDLRRRKGDSPTADEYCDRFPDIEKQRIKDLFLFPAPPPPKLNGPMLPERYRPLEEIGRGGIGSIWRVHDKNLDRRLAAKVLHDRFRNDRGANLRLDREAHLTGLLQHPGIPPVHDRGKLLSGSSFFTMKLVEGETLGDIVSNSSDLVAERIRLLNIFQQIAQTTAYAHSQKIIHRDLKPKNIMVGKFGEVQIMDWGMAKLMSEGELESPHHSASADISNEKNLGETFSASNDSSFDPSSRSLTRHGDVFGTPAYMPPEQAHGALDQMSERSDVFSLGAILLEVLTGKPLYDEYDASEIVAAAQSCKIQKTLERLNGSRADDDLIDLTKRCLSANPVERPRDGQEVADRISEYLLSVERRLKDAEVRQGQAEVKLSEERKRRRLAVLLVATVLVAGTAAISGILWFQYQAKQQQMANLRSRTQTMSKAVGAAPLDAMEFAIENLRQYDTDVVNNALGEQFENSSDSLAKLKYAIARSFFGKVHIEYLVNQIETAKPQYLSLIAKALAKAQSDSVNRVREQVTTNGKESNMRKAVLLFVLGDQALLHELLTSKDSEQRAAAKGEFLDVLSQWQGSVNPFLKEALQSENPLWAHALIVGCAEMNLDFVSTDEREQWQSELERTCIGAKNSGVRAAAEIVLRRWQFNVPQDESRERPRKDFNWYVNSVGQTMVEMPIWKRKKFPITEQYSGGYRFFVSDREVTCELFRKFIDEDEDSAKRKIKEAQLESLKYRVGESYREASLSAIKMSRENGPSTNRPICNISYGCAMRFCNWLSRREGLIPFYIDNSPQSIKDSISTDPRYERWSKNHKSNGYRLPDSPEYTFLADSDLENRFWESPRKSQEYFGWFQTNTSVSQPVATKLPGEIGLFDVRGNLGEFTDSYVDVRNEIRVSIEGGSFKSTSSIQTVPDIRPYYFVYVHNPKIGLRVVRVVNEELKERRTTVAKSTLARLTKMTPKTKESKEILQLVIDWSRLGHDLKGLEMFPAAQLAYEKSLELSDLLVERKYQTARCLALNGGDHVNSALVLKKLNLHALANVQLDYAKRDLERSLGLDPKQFAATKFEANRKRVVKSIGVAQASYMATHFERGLSEPELAMRIVESLKLDEADKEHHVILKELAACYAAAHQFDLAINLQNEAIELLPQTDIGMLKEYESRLKKYQNNKKFVQPIEASHIDIIDFRTERHKKARDTGVKHLQQGNWARAVYAFWLCRELNSTSIAVFGPKPDLLIDRGGNCVNQAIGLRQLKEYDEAIRLLDMADSDLTKVLSRDPENTTAIKFMSSRDHVYLSILLQQAFVLATDSNEKKRDGSKALALVRKAQRMQGKDSSEVFAGLAAALAENKEFKEAAEVQQKAIELLPMSSRMRKVYELRLEQFRQEKPLRVERNE